MKNIICIIIFICTISGCKDKGPTPGQIEIAKMQARLRQDSIDRIEFEKYIQFQVKMHTLLAQLGYSYDSAQREIDSGQMKMYRERNFSMPNWYYEYRKRRDSSFSVPDSLLEENRDRHFTNR